MTLFTDILTTFPRKPLQWDFVFFYQSDSSSRQYMYTGKWFEAFHCSQGDVVMNSWTVYWCPIISLVLSLLSSISIWIWLLENGQFYYVFGSRLWWMLFIHLVVHVLNIGWQWIVITEVFFMIYVMDSYIYSRLYVKRWQWFYGELSLLFFMIYLMHSYIYN